MMTPLNVNVTDIAGNTASATETNYEIDTTAPTVPPTPDLQDESDTGASNTDNLTNDNTPSFDVQCSEAGIINLFADEINIGNHICTGTESAVIMSSTLDDETYDVTTTATDDLGNESSPSLPLSFTIDTTIDATTINTPTNTQPVSGQAEANSSVTLTSPSGAICTTTTNAEGNYSCILSPTPLDGEDITATATDIYGNTDTETVTAGIDINAPKTPAIDPIASGDTPITGIGEDGTIITLDIGTCLNAPIIVTAGIWSCDINPSNAPTRGQRIAATSTDTAGNVSIARYDIPNPRSGGSRRVSQERINEIFGRTVTVPVVTPTPTNPFGGEQCPAETILTQNFRSPVRDGVFNNYTKGIVNEATILQSHMNRLGFNSGPEDGILGPLSDRAIKRMQIFLGTTPDGFVGPITRELINTSCGTPTETTPVIPTSQCLFETNAKAGDEGEHVMHIQTFLASQGILLVTPNGFYGPATSAATRAFQNKYSEIYTSAGLIQATDWFYTNSRAKATEVCEKNI
jgi:hypothetical protein